MYAPIVYALGWNFQNAMRATYFYTRPIPILITLMKYMNYISTCIICSVPEFSDGIKHIGLHLLTSDFKGIL